MRGHSMVNRWGLRAEAGSSMTRNVVTKNAIAAVAYALPSPKRCSAPCPHIGPIARPRLSSAPAAPCTVPCSSFDPLWLTSVTIDALHNPTPMPAGISASRNIGTVLDAATSAHPAAAMTSPASSVRRTPIARTTMPTNPACTMTPSTPNAASTYPVRTTSNPNRRDAKSANVVVHTANEHQYTKSAISSGRRCGTAEHFRQRAQRRHG